MANILVLGGYGLLGSSLGPFLERHGHRVIRQGRQPEAQLQMELNDPESLANVLRSEEIHCIINLTAITNVDYCENHVREAYEVHVRIPETITRAMQLCRPDGSTHLIQISTDQVYDAQQPSRESQTAPGNVYALSKLAGEYALGAINATILRTNFFGKSQTPLKGSFSDWIIASLRARKQITVFDDVKISALNIQTLCTAIEFCVRRRKPGTFNVGTTTPYSKADLAFMLAEKLQLDCTFMQRGSVETASFQAIRPKNMSMNVEHFTVEYGFKLPTIESQIADVAKEYEYE